MVRRTKASAGNLDMKSSVVAALGAALIATLGLGSAAHAAIVSFSFGAFGTITHDGASLDESTFLDFDDAAFVVMVVDPGDSSGLALFDPINLSAPSSPDGTTIEYGAGNKPSDFPTSLGAEVILSWPVSPEPGADVFTETLTTVDTIDRGTPDEITVTLSGTLSDSAGNFKDSPALVVLNAAQDLDASSPTVTFTNESGSIIPSIPEPSTWVMMALGFGALGYAAVRRRKTNVSMLCL
jgi:PEP-CTERM motif